VFSVLGIVGLSAQQKSAWDPGTPEQLKQLQSAALSDSYAYDEIEHLTDSIGPRPIGSPQAAAAIEYVAAEMRKLGLDVHLEKVSVPRWVRGDEHAELVGYPGQVPGTQQKIVVTSLAAPQVATGKDGLTAEVVVVNSLDDLHALPKEKVAGKIVVFNEIYDDSMASRGFALEAYEQVYEYRYIGRLEAAKMGAVASLVRSTGSGNSRTPHTGLTAFDKEITPIPAGALTGEDAALLARLTKQGPVKMHLVMTSQWLPNVDSYNVVADLKGSESPEQVVIVSGHLDSWDLGTGAIDDGAGVGLAMQVPKLIKQLGLKPKRTIRVIAWISEETGVDGGLVYAKQHAEEIANHFAAIESDMGAGHPLGVQFGNDEKIGELLGPVMQVLRTSGAGLIRPSEDTGSDIDPLNVRGVPTFSPIQDARKYFLWHHTAADTFDKIDLHELRENGAIMTVLAYALANMNGELPRKTKPIPDWMK
jgi:Zn-dependent M28 family amino/carboxypeptidase